MLPTATVKPLYEHMSLAFAAQTQAANDELNTVSVCRALFCNIKDYIREPRDYLVYTHPEVGVLEEDRILLHSVQGQS